MSYPTTWSFNTLLMKQALKDRYTLFFLVNCVFLASLLSLLFLSVFYSPLPLPIFITLFYCSFSYFLILFFKLIEKNLFLFKHYCSYFQVTISKKLYFISTGFLIFILLVSAYFIIVPIERGFGDVDNAIMTAAQSFSNGINPYIVPIVPHIHNRIDNAGLYSNSTSETILGTYNYLPVDLLFYSLSYALFSPYFGYLWYYITNFIVISLCIIIVAHFYPLSIFKCIVIFIPAILFGALVFNDIWLILFFILFMIWVDKHKNSEIHSKTYYLVATTLLTMGFLTKMLLIFILPVFLLYRSKIWLERFFYGLYSAVFSMVVISFFDFRSVINSVIFFNSNIKTRSELAFISGILALPLQFMNLTIFYIPLFILSYVFVLYISRFYSSSLEGRILFVSAILIVLLPSGNFIATIWIIFIFGVYTIYNNYEIQKEINYLPKT